jgi:hypothetical protein
MEIFGPCCADSGVLRVDLLDGKGLPSADRNGKSDPYCVFTLADEKVFKSEVVKKTLAPVWNEKFEVQVPSREAAKFVVEVYDWDRVGALCFFFFSPFFPFRPFLSPTLPPCPLFCILTHLFHRYSRQTRLRNDRPRFPRAVRVRRANGLSQGLQDGRGGGSSEDQADVPGGVLEVRLLLSFCSSSSI